MMVRFQGFETKEEAKAFLKTNGKGTLCYEKSYTESKGKNQDLYKECVLYGGLDSRRFPYAVQWNEFR